MNAHTDTQPSPHTTLSSIPHLACPCPSLPLSLPAYATNKHPDMSFFLTFLGFDLTPPRPFPHGGSLEHYGEGIQRSRESAEIRAWLAIYPPSPPLSTTPRTTPPLLPIDHLRELREPTPPLSPIDHTSPVTPIWAYHLFTPPPPPRNLGTKHAKVS